jgi:hypothetical protein
MWTGRLQHVAAKLDSHLRDQVAATILLVDIWNDRFFLKRQVQIKFVTEKQEGASTLANSQYAIHLTYAARKASLGHELSADTDEPKQVSHRSNSI